jgi:hypothetical protein
VIVGFGTDVHKNLLSDFGLWNRCPKKFVECLWTMVQMSAII